MATASLDGLRIEIAHTSSPDDVATQLVAFAEDLAANKFSEWGIRIEQRDAGCLDLIGERNGTHFKAEVVPGAEQVVLTLAGQVQISRIKLTLAGGAAGLRRRVSDEISRVLQKHLGS